MLYRENYNWLGSSWIMKTFRFWKKRLGVKVCKVSLSVKQCATFSAFVVKTKKCDSKKWLCNELIISLTFEVSLEFILILAFWLNYFLTNNRSYFFSIKMIKLYRLQRIIQARMITKLTGYLRLTRMSYNNSRVIMSKLNSIRSFSLVYFRETCIR